MSQSSSGAAQELRADEVVLADILLAVWKSRWLVAAFVVAAMTAGALVSVFTARVYKATVLLAPVASEEQGGVGGVMSQLGGIANLIGLGGRGSDRTAEAIATLESDALAMRYIKDNDLLPILFPDLWDKQQGRWTDAKRPPPTLWKGSREFAKHRLVLDDPKTGLVQVVVRSTDPQIAAKWANDLVALTNEQLRQSAISLSDKNIAYLSAQAAKASVVALETSINALLQQEMRAQMLARGNDSYAFKVLDPAVPPEEPDSAGLLLWLLVSAVGGMGCGVLVALLLYGFRR